MIKLLNESGDETQKFTSLYLVEQINLFREQEKNKSKLRHSDFLRKIEAEFEEEIAERKISFRLISKELETGSTRTKVYELDYDQSLQILMSESRFVRKAVINVIKRQQAEIEALKPKLPNFEDPAEAAIAWAKEYKEKQLALKQIEEQKEIIEIQAPKVEFAEQLLKSTNAIDFSTASKAMNLPFGRNKLFEKLRELKILDARNNPYQNYVDRGYFTILETSFVHPKTGDRQMTFKTMITASGQDYVLKNLRKNNIIN